MIKACCKFISVCDKSGGDSLMSGSVFFFDELRLVNFLVFVAHVIFVANWFIFFNFSFALNQIKNPVFP